MNGTNLRRGCALALTLYILLAVGFYAIAGEQLRVRDEKGAAVTPAQPVGELVAGLELRQRFSAPGDQVTAVTLRLSTFGRENSCTVALEVQTPAGRTLARAEVPAAQLRDNSEYTFRFAAPADTVRGEGYDLVLLSPDGTSGNAVTAWFGNSMALPRGEVPISVPEEEQLLVGGARWECRLSAQIHTRSFLWLGRVYWYLAAAGGAVLALGLLWLMWAAKRGKQPLALRVAAAFRRYGYLLRQLIARDFKAKYKRSVLGVVWSFLNPLLTMAVQYLVFSTLFRSDIPNFPLYLLTGIVCFNFFSEAAGMGLLSIVGNASLITKVYVPKYIYPLSRVLSSGVNFLLSLIPLFLVMLLTGTPLRPAAALLPFGIVCLGAFCIGMALILSTMMVFFRDTQFLWGVVSMLWMYLTPIFYPDTIIPEQFMALYKCNPLYHIIRFFRILLMDGISPEPKAYALCLIASLVPLALGAWIFKKNQDKFILNL